MKLAALAPPPAPPVATGAPTGADAGGGAAFSVDLAQRVEGAAPAAAASPSASASGSGPAPASSASSSSSASQAAAGESGAALSLEALLQAGATDAPAAQGSADALRMRARAALEQALHAQPAQAQTPTHASPLGFAALGWAPASSSPARGEGLALPGERAVAREEATSGESAWGLPMLVLPPPMPAAAQTSALAAVPSLAADAGAAAPLSPPAGAASAALASAAPQAGVAMPDAVVAALENPAETLAAADAPRIEAATASSGFAALLAPTFTPGAERAALPGAPPPVPILQPQAPQQLAETVVWQLDAAVQEAQIQLHPQELGPLEVKIRIEGEKVAVRFDMADASVRDVVQSSLPNLASLLSARGLALDQAQVFSQPRGHADAPPQRDPENPGSGSGDKTESVTAAPRRVLHRGLIDHYA